MSLEPLILFFFFNDTATTEIYTLSLHDALPIWRGRPLRQGPGRVAQVPRGDPTPALPGGGRHAPAPVPPQGRRRPRRSEEHTSELQSRQYLVCRLLLEKKKNQ